VLDRKPLNAAWQKHFGRYPTVNLGMAGDKTQNVLWRLDHGGVAGLQPRLVVLLIGNNNMFYTRETGVAAAAQGIKACVENLRAKFPEAELVVATIFPAHAPGHAFYEDIKQTNAALRAMKLERDPKVHVIDPWPEMIEADGTLRRGLFQVDNIHLTQGDGYAFFATQLQPVVARLLR
jgi:lysophospholipase L1-like esterase